MESELFNRQIDNYVIELYGDFDSGMGFDAVIDKSDGTQIGKIESVGEFRKKIIMYDVDNNPVLIVRKKAMSWHNNYTIKDSDGNEIGKARTLGRFKDDFVMADSKSKKTLTKYRPEFLTGLNEIVSDEGDTVATFEVKHIHSKKSFWEYYDYYTCNLQIKETDFDRKFLWGFLISDCSRFFDTRKWEPTG